MCSVGMWRVGRTQQSREMPQVPGQCCGPPRQPIMASADPRDGKPQCPDSPPDTSLGSGLPRGTLGWHVLEFCWLEEPGKALYSSPIHTAFL